MVGPTAPSLDCRPVWHLESPNIFFLSSFLYDNFYLLRECEYSARRILAVNTLQYFLCDCSTLRLQHPHLLTTAVDSTVSALWSYNILLIELLDPPSFIDRYTRTAIARPNQIEGLRIVETTESACDHGTVGTKSARPSTWRAPCWTTSIAKIFWNSNQDRILSRCVPQLPLGLFNIYE